MYTRLSKDQWRQVALLVLSAITSFIIAHQLGIAHAFWASMPTWVIPQENRDDLIVRALNRILGTIIGGLIALVIVLLITNVFVKIIFLGLFIGLFTCLSKFQKNRLSYSHLLTAVTIMIVSLPALYNPSQASQLMQSRFYCTLIGVMVVMLITYFNTPVKSFNRSDFKRIKKSKFKLALNFEFIKIYLSVFLLTIFSLIFSTLNLFKHDQKSLEAFSFGVIVFAIVLGVQENPKTQGRLILLGAIVGSLFGLLYRILLLPFLTHELLLYLSLLPFFIVGACARVTKLGLKGAIDANLCFLLIAQPDGPKFLTLPYLNHVFSLFLGALIITAIFQHDFFESKLKTKESR